MVGVTFLTPAGEASSLLPLPLPALLHRASFVFVDTGSTTCRNWQPDPCSQGFFKLKQRYCTAHTEKYLRWAARRRRRRGQGNRAAFRSFFGFKNEAWLFFVAKDHVNPLRRSPRRW